MRTATRYIKHTTVISPTSFGNWFSFFNGWLIDTLVNKTSFSLDETKFQNDARVTGSDIFFSYNIMLTNKEHVVYREYQDILNLFALYWSTFRSILAFISVIFYFHSFNTYNDEIMNQMFAFDTRKIKKKPTNVLNSDFNAINNDIASSPLIPNESSIDTEAIRESLMKESKREENNNDIISKYMNKHLRKKRYSFCSKFCCCLGVSTTKAFTSEYRAKLFIKSKDIIGKNHDILYLMNKFYEVEVLKYLLLTNCDVSCIL